MAWLSRITVYPLKSFDGVEVDHARLLPSGALEHDRQFALVDESGRLMTAKRSPHIHSLVARLNPTSRTILCAASRAETPMSYHVDRDREVLETWFSHQLKTPLRLIENSEVGFPDDLDSPGPTVVAAASVQAVGEWFGFSAEECRRRFRANLELDGLPSFGEDDLLASPGNAVPFRIGDVVLLGTNPCQRCVVPSRDSQTGEVPIAQFQKLFSQQRQPTIPGDDRQQRFDHAYRFSVNSRLQQGAGKALWVGDEIQIMCSIPLAAK